MSNESTRREPQYKQFTWPDGSEIHSAVMREVFVRDDYDIGTLCDAAMAKAIDPSLGSFYTIQKREAVRISFVAIQRTPDSEWERVNEAGAYFMEMDDWKQSSYTLALRAYGELNGVSDSDGFTKGAKTISKAGIFALLGSAPGGGTAQGRQRTDEPAGG